MRIFDNGSAVVAFSPAKLNLQLALGQRRTDGYHEIETVMVKVSLFDRLRTAIRSDGRLSLSIRRLNASVSESIPLGEDNLVLKAAIALQHEAGVRFGADLHIDKRIPAEAGLAGGSGNAAAALLALNRLWRLNLSAEKLQSLASGLGSDVPFFLDRASAAVATGRGERFAPAPMRGPFRFVIFKPMFGLSTAGVYQAYANGRPKFQPEAGPVVEALAQGSAAKLRGTMGNALTAAAEDIRPEIADLRKQLSVLGLAGCQMTGSGSAVFGLGISARQAKRVARELQAKQCGTAFAVTSL